MKRTIQRLAWFTRLSLNLMALGVVELLARAAPLLRRHLGLIVAFSVVSGAAAVVRPTSEVQPVEPTFARCVLPAVPKPVVAPSLSADLEQARRARWMTELVGIYPVGAQRLLLNAEGGYELLQADGQISQQGRWALESSAPFAITFTPPVLDADQTIRAHVSQGEVR